MEIVRKINGKTLGKTDALDEFHITNHHALEIISDAIERANAI